MSIPGAKTKPTILFADDDSGDQELVRVALYKSGCDADLRIVSDGSEALDYLHASGRYHGADPPTPDLILLDLNMPKMNGADLLQSLRGDRDLRSIPVIVFTTSDAQADVDQCYDLGCNSFITKPADVEEFIATIRHIWSYWFGLVALPKSAAGWASHGA